MKHSVSSDQLFQRLLIKGRLRQFQMVLAVAELGNTHQASRNLSVTQPAITKVIQDIEQELGLAIFERHARGMRLTAAGREIVPFMRRILEATERCAETVAVRLNTGSTTVRVGAVAAGLSGLLAPYLPDFSKAHPDIQLNVYEIDGRRIGAMIAEEEYDIFICRAPETVPDAWTFLPLVSDEHAIIAAADHPLTRRSTLKLKDLAGCIWLLPPQGVPALDLFRSLLAKIRVQELCQIATRSPVLIREALRQRHALSIAPISIFRSDLAAGTLRRIDFDLDGAMDPLGLLVHREAAGDACNRLVRYLADRTSLGLSERPAS